jgi:hypothetical protein
MPTSVPRRRTLDPKNDVVFKLLFAAERNRDLLIALLTAVLDPPSPIETAEVLNPDIDREHWDDKGPGSSPANSAPVKRTAHSCP